MQDIKPLLMICDSPSGVTGLGRITRELATHVYTNLSDVFRVGTLAHGGSSGFKWPQYRAQVIPNTLVITNLADVWEEFSKGQDGIIFTCLNPSWLEWFANPELMEPGPSKRFLKSEKFKRWGYFAVDATGPNSMTGVIESDIMGKFDRILMYTEWAKKLLRGRLPFHPIDHLPHGTDGRVFYPRDRKEAREKFIGTVVKRDDVAGKLDDNTLLLGCIATATPRKDYGLTFETCAELLKRGVDVGLWVHTDAFRNHWDLLTMADDFGMKERTIFTSGNLPDETLAWGMAAMDVILLNGAGEGWGLVGSSSLAMGIPVVGHKYAASTEFVPPEFLVEPAAWRWEGYHCNRRPVGDPSTWADRVLEVKDKPCSLDEKFLWDGPNGAWSQWEKWLRAGL